MWCRYVDVNNSGWSKSSSERDWYFYVLCFTWGRKMAPVYGAWMRAGAGEGGEERMLEVCEVKGERWQKMEKGGKIKWNKRTERKQKHRTEGDWWRDVLNRRDDDWEEKKWRKKWRGDRMTLMAFGLGASSFYEDHELNIAPGQSGRTGYGASH